MVIRVVLGIVIGGGLSALLFSSVSCPTGGCPLTGSPYGRIILGAIVGLMIAISIK